MTAASGFWILAAAALKATVLLGVASLLALGLRRGSGRLRHLVWTTALAGAFVLPFLWWMAIWRLELLPHPAVAAQRSTATVVATPARAESPAAERPALRTFPPPRSSAQLPLWERGPGGEGLLLGLWALGTLLVVGRLVSGQLGVARLGRSARDPGDPSWPLLLAELAPRIGLRRPVRLYETADVATPMTGGLLRPAVFLPPDAAAWPLDRRRVVLTHELVHVRRGDAWGQVLADLACALYWWNPLAWLGRRRLKADRETACDEAVIALGTRPSDYAAHLLEISASLAACRRVAAPAVLPMIQPTQLEGRVMSILTANPRRRGAALLVAPPVLMTALVFLLAAADLWGDPSPPPGSSSSSSRDDGSWTYIDDHGRVMVGPDGYLIDQRLDDGLRFYVRAPLDVEIAADGTVRGLQPGADLVLETSWHGVEPRLRISAEAGGEPRYAWSIGGVERPFDEPARQWTQGMLATFSDLSEVIRLRGQIGELRGDIGRIRGERGRLQGEIGRIQGERGRLQGEIGRIRGEQGRMRGEIGRVQGEAGRLRGEIGRIRGDRGRLQGEIGRLRGQIAVLRQLDYLGDELSAEERTRRDDRVEAKEAEIRKIERQIDDLDVEGKVSEIERQIEALDVEGRRDAIEKEISAADTEGRVAEIEKEIEALDVEGKADAIRKQIDGLEVETHTAETERQIDDLEKRLAPVESKLDGDYDEVKRLTSQVH